MANPFDDPDGHYSVLVNAEGQHSLWPAIAEVPAGWEVVLERRSRDQCLEYVDLNWTDLRPESLRGESATPRTGKLVASD